MTPRDFLYQHTHIAIDLDDTLIDTFSSFLTVSHTVGKLLKCSRIEDITNYRLEENKHLHLDRNEVELLWKNYWNNIMSYGDIPPIPYSYQTIKMIQQKWIQCSLVTARNWSDPQKRKHTEMLVCSYFPELFHEIHYSNHYEWESRRKSEICKELWITLLIDDAFENALDMIENGLSVILMEKPWNREIQFEHKNLLRVKNWEEIQRYV